jgi:chromosome segregation ATPase
MGRWKIFGWEENSRLKEQLAEKDRSISGLRAQIAQLNARISRAEQDSNGLADAVVDTSAVYEPHQSQPQLSTSLVSARDREMHRLQETIKSIAKEKAEAIHSLQCLLQGCKAQVDAKDRDIQRLQGTITSIAQERDAATSRSETELRELQRSRKRLAEKNRGILKREEELTQGLESLRLQREQFQQRMQSLLDRESHWKQSIEPFVTRYEAHEALDQRKAQLDEQAARLEQRDRDLKEREQDLIWRQVYDDALNARAADLDEQSVRLDERDRVLAEREQDMVRRKCVDDALKAREVAVAKQEKLLSAQATELVAKASGLAQLSTELDAQGRELSVFRARVAKIDAETARLESLSESLQIAGQQQRQSMAELQEQRAKLRQEAGVLHRRAGYLEERERAVAHQETGQWKTWKQEKSRLLWQIQGLQGEVNRLRDFKTQYEGLQIEFNRQLVVSKQHEALLAAAKRSGSSFMNPRVLAWLTEGGGPEEMSIENGWLGSTGFGPWPDQVLESNLVELDYKFYELPDRDLEHIIVGRRGWSKSELLAQIEERDGGPLRIYSQEMFCGMLATGRDPFDEDDSTLLEAFAEDHPALQFLMSLPEPWPEVRSEDSGEVVEIDGREFGVSESPLHLLGYRVGASSTFSASARRAILSTCFEAAKLPFSEDSDEDYKAHWGRPRSAQRLYRMAVHIRSLADGRVGKDPRKPQARADWVSDLRWLKKEYFSTYKTKFRWPGVG